MLFIAYSTLFPCFGKWDLICDCHQNIIGQRGPTLVSHSLGLSVGKILPLSYLDHGKIMVRLFSPCNAVVVFVSYGLIGSLVTLHDCGTSTLTFRSCRIVGLMHSFFKSCLIVGLACESLNHQKTVCVHCSSCIHLLHLFIHQV